MEEQRTVYLDTNATTPLADEVLDTVSTALCEAWGNASSSHAAGRKAKDLISWSRRKVADMVCADPDDVFFTSGGTEANNWVFHSVARSWRDEMGAGGCPHVVISTLEHDSVSEVAAALQNEGLLDVTVSGWEVGMFDAKVVDLLPEKN